MRSFVSFAILLLSSSFASGYLVDGDTCPGICIVNDGDTLVNEFGVVTIDGSKTICRVLDEQNRQVGTNLDLCRANAVEAIDAGCKCAGGPTDKPTTSTKPTLSPTLKPTLAPSSSSAPSETTLSARPSTPVACPGVCKEGDTLLNPDKLVAIVESQIYDFCKNIDARNKDLINQQATCDFQGNQARRAGCRCGTPIDCPGICTSFQNEVVVNPDFGITLDDGSSNTCGGYDAEWDAYIDPRDCNDVPAKINEALSKGCKCDVPVNCNGLCNTGTGEVIVNPTLEISLSDNNATGTLTATCRDVNNLFDAVIDPDACDIITDTLVGEAIDAGCKCAVPITCPGLCVDPTNDQVVLLNGDTEVEFQGETKTCTAISTELKTIIDGDVCQPSIDEAVAAGCKCGVPFKCPGICLNGQKVFDKNVVIDWDGKQQKCKDVEKINKNIIEEEVCKEKGREAVQAGCQCGETTEMPSGQPTVSVPPTLIVTNRPTRSPLPPPPSWPTAQTPNSPSDAQDTDGSSSTLVLMNLAIAVAVGGGSFFFFFLV